MAPANESGAVLRVGKTPAFAVELKQSVLC
jgi:hypothetical protein